MDLFIATLPYEFICPRIARARDAMGALSLRTWRDAGFRPTLIEPPDLDLDLKSFQRERRIIAEELARTKYYLSTSDDVLPDVTTFDTSKAQAIMESHPKFAILACWPLNETINRWTPNNYEVFEDDDVMEHYSVGTISFIRKGAMLDWPKMGEGRGYDSIQCEYLRSHGWRVGLLKNMGCVHLGKGFSTVTPCSPS